MSDDHETRPERLDVAVDFPLAEKRRALIADVDALCARRGWEREGGRVQMRRGSVTLNWGALAGAGVNVEMIEAMIDRQATLGALADDLDASPIDDDGDEPEGER